MSATGPVVCTEKIASFIQSLEPFQVFRTVAAQMNGKIVNYSAIAHDVGVSTASDKSTLDSGALSFLNHRMRTRTSGGVETEGDSS